jgi:hypothetical protein
VIGRVEDDVLKFLVDGEQVIASPVSELEGVWESSLENALQS